MALLILNVEGSSYVQAVRLDDPSPGYGAAYAARVAEFLDPAAVLRYVEVDVSSVAEFGPDDVAAMLSGDEALKTDLSQTWEAVTS